MKYIGFLVFLFLGTGALAQSQADLDLLLKKQKENKLEVQNQEKFKGLLKVYNRYFSEQILNDCIYDHSCSTFSQGAINEYGLIKGGLLSGYRLLKCNRASAVDYLPVSFTKNGKIKDSWERYHFH